MTEINTYAMPFRRRREERTNYKKRLALLKSGKLRLGVRKTNNNSQVGDECLVMAQSSELRKLGWTRHTGNLPAAYLTGYLCGKKAKKQSLLEAVLDIGLLTPVHGSTIFAVLRGVVDSGVGVACDKEVFPSDERATGKHLGGDATQLFELVKKEIDAKYGG
ncbi:MAG: 50S ribosomal protein L18 [Candidatus Diapherotrites archaeon]|uniref:Large ribosomal subunit protein uL18 n=1 Tax=Candidatus Iainarchaeum sp. TaxID=3101447 RepID=A0A8T4L772_9ARCH|nr:50S ribosomal protein L18 [Candidatus Diapherotrites archaeon]